jgi:hypothetical protein
VIQEATSGLSRNLYHMLERCRRHCSLRHRPMISTSGCARRNPLSRLGLRPSRPRSTLARIAACVLIAFLYRQTAPESDQRALALVGKRDMAGAQEAIAEARRGR